MSAADRHWGISQVRAPTAKDATRPDGGPEPSPARAPRSGPTPLRPMRVGRPAPPPPPATAWEAAPPGPGLRRAPDPPAGAGAAATAPEAPADQSLARLARGLQDCARALESLADRIDGLEARLDDAIAPPPAPGAAAAPDGDRSRPNGPRSESVETRLGALEGMSTDRFQALDQRLRRLEALPEVVERLRQDTVLLADVSRSRPSASEADLAPIYQELDSVADLVSTHHAAASQSLERVRTLERAALELRRHLERSLADLARVLQSDQGSLRSRLDAVEARLRVLTAQGLPAADSVGSMGSLST